MNDGRRKPSPNRDYEVGYGKQPKQHRFDKGQSGNARGRPRNTRQRKRPDAFEERIKSLIVDEAYRKITVREGEKLVQLAAIEAIIRSLSIAAAKGNSRAQRMFVDLLRWVEGDRRAARLEFFKETIEYKCDWERTLEERKRNGTTGTEPIPHPDDIEIDLYSGEVRFKGPLTKEQKDAQDQLVAMRPKVERDIRRVRRRLAKEPDNPAHQRTLHRHHETLQMIRIVEDLVEARAAPPRPDFVSPQSWRR